MISLAFKNAIFRYNHKKLSFFKIMSTWFILVSLSFQLLSLTIISENKNWLKQLKLQIFYLLYKGIFSKYIKIKTDTTIYNLLNKQ